MKPLFICSLYHPNQVGGAEKVVRILAEGMLQHGHQPVVFTTQEGPGDRVDQVDGVKVHYIGLKNIYWPHSRKERPGIAKALWHGIDRYNALMARAVARVLDTENPDVVNTHNLTGFSCAAWNSVKSRRLPLIHTLHDYSLMCPKTSMFKDGGNCQGQCTTCALYTSPSKRMSQTVGHVVGVSRFTLERHLAAGYFQAARQAQVIHNGLPGHPSAAPRQEGPGRPLQLGYVGHLIPQKGIRELVRQMGDWQSGQCELLVAGKGAAAYEAMLRAEAPKNVRFLGFVNPDEVYRTIDLLVVPSLSHEALATTVLEAYMHGVPVIVSRRGGLPEMVEEGRTGLTYEPLEPGALREAVDVFLRDRPILQDMRLAALKKASHFLQRRMQAQYLDLMADAKAALNIDELRTSA
jgi:glycosyltransferase involved in cell wall biosynthesis